MDWEKWLEQGFCEYWVAQLILKQEEVYALDKKKRGHPESEYILINWKGQVYLGHLRAVEPDNFSGEIFDAFCDYEPLPEGLVKSILHLQPQRAILDADDSMDFREHIGLYARKQGNRLTEKFSPLQILSLSTGIPTDNLRKRLGLEPKPAA